MNAELRICAGIPAYDAGDTVGDVVRRTLQHLPVVLVVDDGSRDGTADAARSAGADVISLPENRGKGNALRILLREAARRGFTAILTLDADGQHDPDEIPRFLEEHRRDPDAIISGSRMGQPERIPPHRLGAMMVARFFVSLAANRFLEDTQCGFRLYPSDLLARIDLRRDRYVTESELLIKVGDSGGRIRTIPIRTIYSTEMESHFRGVRDVASITAYVITYLMVKWWIEGTRPGTRYTYQGKGTGRDALAALPVPEVLLEVLLIAFCLPLTVLYGIGSAVSTALSLGVFDGWRRSGVPTARIVLGALFLPVLLVISIANRLANMLSGGADFSYRVIRRIYDEPSGGG